MSIGGSRSSRLAKAVLRAREISIFTVILVVFGITTLYNHNFADPFLECSTTTRGCLGHGNPCRRRDPGNHHAGNVDLSIGSVLGLSAYVVGDLFAHNPHFPVLLGFVAGTFVGLACGMINGAIVAIALIIGLVVTLGTLYAIRGFDTIVVNGLQINPSSFPAVLSA